jgi:Mrp family chromosome partitioning ATPase
LTQLRNTRSDLELNSDLIQQSEILQRADEAEPVKSRALLYGIAALLLGLAGGASLAVSLASGPRRFLSEDEISESLGSTVAVRTPKVRELHSLSRKAIEPHHREFNQAIDRLSVRIDNAQVGDGALTVLVAGSNRTAGTTTLAMALAGRFADTGVRTVLVDANVKNPDISRVFGATSSSGTDGLLLDRPTDDYLVPTDHANLSVIAVGRSIPLDRSNAFVLLERLENARIAEVIIIDGGPLLDVVSSARMSHIASSIVLAVPTKFRGVRQLASMQRLLEGAAGTVHPVLTAPGRRSVAPLPTSSPSVLSTPVQA